MTSRRAAAGVFRARVFRAGMLGAVAGVLLGALAAAGPALAHGADAPAGTDYRTTVVGLTPAVPGLRVRVIEAGARLERCCGYGPRARTRPAADPRPASLVARRG